MNLFAETLVQFILGVVWWVVLFPVLWLAATPAIMVLAAFQNEPYSIAVRRMYSSVTRFWIDYGALFTP
jgi:hypothetical protein